MRVNLQFQNFGFTTKLSTFASSNSTDYLVLLSAGVGSKVLSTGSNNVGLINRDNSTVGVGNKTSVGNSGSVGKSMGSKVVSLGSSNSGLINRDNSTVGVGSKTAIGISSIGIGVGTSIGIGVGSSIGIGVGTSISIRISIDSSLGGKVGSTGQSDSRFVSGNHSSVRVGHQAGGGDSDAGSENQKLHVDVRVSASV